MRTNYIFTVALAIALLGATASVAQPTRGGSDRNGRIERQMHHRDFGQHGRGERRDVRIERRDDRRDYGAFRGHYRPAWQNFRRGRFVDRYDRNEFRRYQFGHRFHFQPHRHVIVNDWDRYHLRRPPRGYHWVRNGDSGDFLLAAITTGLILDVFFNRY